MILTPTQQRITATLIVVLVLVLVIHHLQPILMPFVMALGLSYLLSPWVDRLQGWMGHKTARALSVIMFNLCF
jgi:predicted PurR-regulated permease PerM